MIQHIYSPWDQSLIAAVIRPQAGIARENAGDEQQILQVSSMCFAQGKTVAAHQHLLQSRTTQGTAEAWVVIQGQMEVSLFDLDQQPLCTVTVGTGDCMVLYRGGHAIQVTTPNTMVYEIKNGPYNGPAADLERL